VIEARYGANSVEAERMKAAAREAVAQKLERGEPINPPLIKDAARDLTKSASRDDKER
jgi:hypothetical protein